MGSLGWLRRKIDCKLISRLEPKVAHQSGPIHWALFNNLD